MAEVTKEDFEKFEIQIGPGDSRKLIDILRVYPHIAFAPISNYEGFLTFYNDEIEEWTRENGTIKEGRRGYLTVGCSQLAYAVLYQRITEALSNDWI